MLQQLTILGQRPVERIRFLAEKDQPTYRVNKAPETCTNNELLAVIISGPRQLELADGLMARFKGDLRALHNASVDQIAAVSGIGHVTAARIKAALAMSTRIAVPSQKPQIGSPSDAAELVMDMGLLEKEHLRVILLDARNQVRDIVEVYKGAVNTSQIRIGEVFQPAVQQHASGIILAHNHPSGEVLHSPDDVAVTRAAVQAGNLLDISVLDHLIIGHGKWASMKQKGVGF